MDWVYLTTEKFNCIVVLGPTASGKTRYACRLAHAMEGEIISADSRQVYKHLQIGTGKDLHEYVVAGKNIPCHLIDLQEPDKQFYLHDFILSSAKAFLIIESRGKMPVFCGGTGLYLDSLRKDLSLTLVPEDPLLRQKLKDLDKEELLTILKQYPSELTAHCDLTSVKRIIRGIEVAENLSVGKPRQTYDSPSYRPFYIGMRSERTELIARISHRLQKRLNEGLIEEVEGLLARGLSHQRLQALGLEYKFISLYLENKIPLDEMKGLLLTAISQYAKRQMTWFRKMEREGVKINWVDPESDVISIVDLFKSQNQGRE